jgi:uncharacterized SAM-binding protein YcdF (DUF218 family)
MDAFFILSKLLSGLLNPLNYCLVLLLAAALMFYMRRVTAAKRLVYTLSGLMIVIGYHPLPTYFLRNLENSVPRTPVNGNNLYGLIVLGGATGDGMIAIDRDETPLNGAAERLTKAVELARKYPELKILFTSFSGALHPEGLNDSEMAQRFFNEQGISGNRVVFENKSRNTFENVMYSRQLLGENYREKWLLITSARHMLRASKIFEKQGWSIIPYPVDYRTRKQTDWLDFGIARGNRTWGLILYEVVGLVAYKLAGRI